MNARRQDRAAIDEMTDFERAVIRESGRRDPCDNPGRIAGGCDDLLLRPDCIDLRILQSLCLFTINRLLAAEAWRRTTLQN